MLDYLIVGALLGGLLGGVFIVFYIIAGILEEWLK